MSAFALASRGCQSASVGYNLFASRTTASKCKSYIIFAFRQALLFPSFNQTDFFHLLVCSAVNFVNVLCVLIRLHTGSSSSCFTDYMPSSCMLLYYCCILKKSLSLLLKLPFPLHFPCKAAFKRRGTLHTRRQSKVA